MASKFRIELRGHGRADVYKDGEKLTGVSGVNVSLGVDAANRVQVSFVAGDVEIVPIAQCAGKGDG